MSDIAISIEEVSKSYRLGVIGSGTLREDLQSWWHRKRGLPDPNQRVDQLHQAVEGHTLWALQDISLQIQQGDVWGIIGRNGAGKSTLLKILSRVTAPTSGRIRVKGRVASLLEVGTGFHPELTGRENIFLNGAILGMTKAEVSKKFDEIVDFSEIEAFIDTPVKRYSSGMYVRLAFAVAAHLEPEILVVDEVLAVGDAAFQKKCLGKMGDVAGEGRTVIFVSHNMAAVRELCKKGVWLRDGRIAGCSSSGDCVSNYLAGDIKVGRSIEFADSPLTRVDISQEGDTLCIAGHYRQDPPFKLPNFGFVIGTTFGEPLFASNPFVSGVEKTSPAVISGTVSARVISPRLKAGRYTLSVWLNDGSRDVFHAAHCLEFDLQNFNSMKQQMDVNLTGHIEPECEWTFSDGPESN